MWVETIILKDIFECKRPSKRVDKLGNFQNFTRKTEPKPEERDHKLGPKIKY